MGAVAFVQDFITERLFPTSSASLARSPTVSSLEMRNLPEGPAKGLLPAARKPTP
jgi:hypothetical protein